MASGSYPSPGQAYSTGSPAQVGRTVENCWRWQFAGTAPELSTCAGRALLSGQKAQGRRGLRGKGRSAGRPALASDWQASVELRGAFRARAFGNREPFRLHSPQGVFPGGLARVKAASPGVAHERVCPGREPDVEVRAVLGLHVTTFRQGLHMTTLTPGLHMTTLPKPDLPVSPFCNRNQR